MKQFALIFLSNVVDENQCSLFQQDLEHVKYLINTFNYAVESSNKSAFGWKAEELAQGIFNDNSILFICI